MATNAENFVSLGKLQTMQFEIGDYVKHKTNPLINDGLRMSVSDVDEENSRIKCIHTENNKESEDWFDFDDVEIVEKSDGGFIDLK